MVIVMIDIELRIGEMRSSLEIIEVNVVIKYLKVL